MNEDSSRCPQSAAASVIYCDRCRLHPAVGYTEGSEYPDSVTVYCKECGTGVDRLILFEKPRWKFWARNSE
jgi:hypothetical protein